MGTKEAERFEEDLDSTEYHDAIEEPTRKEESEEPQLPLKPGGISGGFGSSSLKECIELLNATVRNSPAPLDSGVGQETAVPSQVIQSPPKPREEQIPGKSMEETLVEEVAVSISTCGSKSMHCADQRRFLQTTRGGFFDERHWLDVTQFAQSSARDLSQQLLWECCKPYLSRHVSVG